MSYVYIETEAGLWTVGFYDPRGVFRPDSDHDNRDAARMQVQYLNGGIGSHLEGDLTNMAISIQRMAP